MNTLSKSLFSILCHTLGRTELGACKSGVGDDYRNHFITSENSTDYSLCISLVELGFMRQRRCSILPETSWLFQVTPEGKVAIEQFAATLEKPKPLSRSKQRYRRYLEYGDMFDSFLAFCRWDAESERSWNQSKSYC